MKEIVSWLIDLEHIACELYQQAAERFQNNKQMAAFLRAMSEDEAWHYHVMASANEYLSRADLSLEPAIVIDAATNTRIENLLQDCRSIFNQKHINTTELLESVVKVEFSEWNDIFYYVVNTLKEHSREFQCCASLIESHKNLILEFLKSQPDGAKFLSEIAGMQKIWNERILVVDDDPAIVDLLEALFKEEIAVETAVNGEAAFGLIASQHFDAIITDIDMPVLDGISLYKKAVKVDPLLKDRVVFFSGDVDNVREKFLSENNLPFIQKPASIKEIKDKVVTIINSRCAI